MIDKIQNKLTPKVKWLFHYLGFIIERVPNENKLYFELNDTHEAVQKHVLKRLTDNIRIANNHKLYNNLLKKYVPEWDSNFTTAMFMGSGLGEFSFNTFRKVHFEEHCYFEKVYFNDSYDLLRIEWFHEHVKFLLKDFLNVAKIYKIIQGDLLSIVYFEFTELIPLSSSKLYFVSFDISRKLIELSRTAIVEELSEVAPDYLRDYKLHAYYRGNILRASQLIKKLSDNRLSPTTIEQVINLQPLVLTHGDIQQSNVFANSCLIDWDSFGFLPLGFESAYILFQSDFLPQKTEGPLTSGVLQNILLDNYKAIISKDQWIGFELSCFYFYFVFNALDERASPNYALQKDIFTTIEQLFKKAKDAIHKHE